MSFEKAIRLYETVHNLSNKDIKSIVDWN